MTTGLISRRQALIARRTALGYTQETFAETIGVDATTVRRWESGRTTPHATTQARIAHALHLDVDDTHDLLQPAAPRRAQTLAKELVDSAWCAWFIRPNNTSSRGRRFGNSDLAQLRQVVTTCKHLDAQLGGGAVYDLTDEIATAATQAMRHHTFDTHTGRDMANAVAAIRTVAGWAAFDQCHHSQAQRHLHAAERLTTATGHRLLRAEIRYRQARLLQHTRHNDDAIALLHFAGSDLPDIHHAEAAGVAMTVTATLAASYAASGHHQHALTLMRTARSYLDRIDTRQRLAFGWHHPSELWTEYARIYRDAARADPDVYADDAVTWSTYALNQYPTSLTRCRALGHVGLAAALLLAGEPDAAMHAAEHARDADVASRRLHERLYWLRRDTLHYHHDRIENFHRTFTDNTPQCRGAAGAVGYWSDMSVALGG